MSEAWQQERARLRSYSESRRCNYNAHIGRPPVFTLERCAAAAAVLADGGSIADGARAADVSRPTLRGWIDGSGSIGMTPRYLSADEQARWSDDARASLSALREAARTGRAVAAYRRYVEGYRRSLARYGCAEITPAMAAVDQARLDGVDAATASRRMSSVERQLYENQRRALMDWHRRIRNLRLREERRAFKRRAA